MAMALPHTGYISTPMTTGNTNDDIGLNPRMTRRQRRADEMRRKALSPLRILLMVLALPLTIGMITIGVYLRISDYERHEAVIHLVALAGCDTVQRLVPGPFFEGRPGYHKRNDPDGDGVACGTRGLQRQRTTAMPGTAGNAPRQTQAPRERTVGTAKFLKP